MRVRELTHSYTPVDWTGWWRLLNHKGEPVMDLKVERQVSRNVVFEDNSMMAVTRMFQMRDKGQLVRL